MPKDGPLTITLDEDDADRLRAIVETEGFASAQEALTAILAGWTTEAAQDVSEAEWRSAVTIADRMAADPYDGEDVDPAFDRVIRRLEAKSDKTSA